MRYKVPFSILTPVDPVVNDWIDTIPDIYRKRPALLDFLVRLAPRIYHTKDPVAQGVNPFYKIIELLNADKLYYDDLRRLKEYYDFDIIRYLTQDNLAENYVGYPCYNAAQLKSALGQRKNLTQSGTLADILANII